MKKILFAMMACVAMFVFSSCEKTESHIFDLTYDDASGDQAEKTAYELNYKDIFIQELSKVATPVTEAQTTFKIDNTKKKKAINKAKAAFEDAAAKAQAKAGNNSIMKGFKVQLMHSVAGGAKDECASYTFK